MQNRNKSYQTREFSYIVSYGRGMARGYLLSIFLFLIFGVVITFTSLGEGIVPIGTTIVMLLGILYSSIHVTSKIRKKGWLHGGLVGLVFFLLLAVLSIFFMEGFMVDKMLGYRAILCTLGGSVGGMIGINIK